MLNIIMSGRQNPFYNKWSFVESSKIFFWSTPPWKEDSMGFLTVYVYVVYGVCGEKRPELSTCIYGTKAEVAQLPEHCKQATKYY